MNSHLVHQNTASLRARVFFLHVHVWPRLLVTIKSGILQTRVFNIHNALNYNSIKVKMYESENRKHFCLFYFPGILFYEIKLVYGYKEDDFTNTKQCLDK